MTDETTFATIEEALAYVEEDGHKFERWSFYLNSHEDIQIYPGIDGWVSECVCRQEECLAHPVLAIISYGPDGRRYFTVDWQGGTYGFDMPWPQKGERV